MKCLTCHGLITNGNCGCSTGSRMSAQMDYAQYQKLLDENRRLRRALAAGPAALRAVALQARAAGETILADGALDCAANVEAAQEAAMKEGT